jgi:nicotinamide riboside kinase
MISRHLKETLVKRLKQSSAVALLGSRQVGKTTLARELDLSKNTHYLDLERPSDLAKLTDPELYLSGFDNQLVIPEGESYPLSKAVTASGLTTFLRTCNTISSQLQ